MYCRHKKTGMTFAHMVNCKGPGDGWVVDQLVEDVESLGHTDTILKTDGDHAIAKVMEAIKEKRSHATTRNIHRRTTRRAMGQSRRALMK